MRLECLTIVFVDIKDYTTKTSDQSRGANLRLLGRFASLVKPLARAFNGTVIKSMGDAYLLSFRSPTDAMLCAMAVQDQVCFRDQHVPAEERFEVRFAVNTGEVRVDKTDIFGEAVNIASRIEGLADGGEIYFSEAVYLMMNKSEIPSEKLGLRKLKGIQDEVLVFRVPKLAAVGAYKLAQAADSAGDERDPTAQLLPYGGLALKKVHTRITGEGLALDGSFHLSGALSEIHYSAHSHASHFVKGRWWRRPLGPCLYGLRLGHGGLRMALSQRTHEGLVARVRDSLRQFGANPAYRRRILTTGLVALLVVTALSLGWRQKQMMARAAQQTQALADMEALGAKKEAAAASAKTRARQQAKRRQAVTQKALDDEKKRKRSWW